MVSDRTGRRQRRRGYQVAFVVALKAGSRGAQPHRLGGKVALHIGQGVGAVDVGSRVPSRFRLGPFRRRMLMAVESA